ncbi:MAG TPA: alpha/beta hydrolase-fold protein [Burkholderiaceae bacterium]
MTKHLATIQLDTGADTTASVIWMHGLGASATDFAGMPQELDLRGLDPIRFIFPYAPVRPVTANNGYVMPAWYDFLHFGFDEGEEGREDESTIRASQALIEQLIEQEVARGIAPERIVIAGFSQGCVMALQTGLRYPKKLGGLMCLSGYLALPHKLAEERSEASKDTPIFMVHGRGDPVIPIQYSVQSRDFLAKLGYQIEWHDYNMQHAVCPEEIGHIGAWLRRVLA